MPCSDGRDLMDSGWEARRIQAELDRVTRVCCDMRTILRRADLEDALTVESRAWIAMHDEIDKQRIEAEKARGERERMRRQALDKLSLEERRVLGL